MSTMKTTLVREVTDEEVSGLIHGTGALSWEWWHSVDPEERDGVAGYLFGVENPDSGPQVVKRWVSTQEIADAAGRFLSDMAEDGPLSGDLADALNEDIGYLDAAEADRVLQRAVLGAEVYA